ncbi:MAG: site-2 protease family protein [Thermoprotei archaeon]
MSSENPTSKKARSSVSFNYGLLTIESTRAAKFIRRISKYRATKILAYLGVPVFIGLLLFAFYLLLSTLVANIFSQAVRQAEGSLPIQSYLLIPGVNPFVPLLYGLIGLVVAVSVHEVSHGVMAWRRNISVESAGVILFLFIPLGAFVRPSESELEASGFSQKMEVFTAGVTSNVTLALIALAVLVLIIMPTVHASALATSGVAVYSVEANSPAQHAGIKPGDVIKEIQGYLIPNTTTLSKLEETVLRPGENVSVVLADGRTVYAVLEANPANTSIALLGFIPFQPQSTLDEWLHPSNPLVYFVPATIEPTPLNPSTQTLYTSSIPGWVGISNTLFWLWWVNINLAVFNALPAAPLDGGQVIREVFLKVYKSKQKAESATQLLSAVIFGLILTLIILPRAF